jgi:hypothetical protein
LPARVVLVLALYSIGMILAKVSGLSCVALTLAKSFGWSYHAVRKRLSEFYKEKQAKSGFNRGVKRQDTDVSACFSPLLRWVLSLFRGRHLALALDVTNLGERFHVLCIRVVVRGVAIAVAWKVLLGGEKEPWGPCWKKLLQGLKEAVPADWMVLVLTDRGLESPTLFADIKEQGWHPLMRVKKGGKFKPKGWGRFYYFHELVRSVGGSFYAEGAAYAGEQMACTLLACWNEGYDEPWLILTDLPPEAGDAVWYGLRAWIEQGFKIIKGGGWDWEKTRMEDPARVERLWLVLAVATLWVVALGAEDEAQEEINEELKRLEREMSESRSQTQERLSGERLRLEKLRQTLQQRQARQQRREELKQQRREQKRREKEAKKAKKEGRAEQAESPTAPTAPTAKAKARTRARKQEGAKARTHRVSTRGLAELNALWRDGRNRLPRRLHPEPLPHSPHSVSSLTEDEFLSQQT